MIPFAQELIFNCKIASARFISEDVFIVTFRDSDKPVTLDEYKELHEGCLAMIGDRKVVSLVDLRGKRVYFSKEARQFASKSSRLNEHRVAEAILVDNSAIQIAANFYLKIFKPPIPSKVFRNEEVASQWLGMQLNAILNH